MIRSIVRTTLRSTNLRITRPLSTLINKQAIPFSLITYKSTFQFAKISKKEKDKQKLDEQKKKAKQEIGDTSTFDLNPFEEKYLQIIENLKHAISLYKIGRLDSAVFSNIYVKIRNSSMPISQAGQIAPKSANSCIFNPYDHNNLDTIQKAIQTADLGLQVSRVDKTIQIVQPSNSMKQIKEKMLQKLKKNNEIYKQKMGKVRNEARDELKKYKKIIPEQRYKVIEKQLNNLYDKLLVQMENVVKDKEKDLKK